MKYLTNKKLINHNKKIDLYLVIYNVKLVFDYNFYPPNKQNYNIIQQSFLLEGFHYIALNVLVKEEINFLIYTK